MDTADVLPCSVPVGRRSTKTGLDIWGNSISWTLLYCANCGRKGGWVPEASIAEGTGFAFYLCPPCGETWGELAGLMAVPDEVFWARVNAAMLEHDDRALTAAEIVDALRDPSHYLNTLARDR